MHKGIGWRGILKVDATAGSTALDDETPAVIGQHTALAVDLQRRLVALAAQARRLPGVRIDFEQRFLIVRGAQAVVAPVGNDEAARIDLFGEHFRGQGVLVAGRLALACSLEADDVAFLGSGPSANEQGEAKCKQLCARHANPSAV